MTTLKAAADALNHDSELWHSVSGSLDAASTNVWCINVTGDAWPTLSGIANLEAAYAEAQSKVEDLLRQGRVQTQDVADELITVRKRLESTDDSVQDSLDSLWDHE